MTCFTPETRDQKENVQIEYIFISWMSHLSQTNKYTLLRPKNRKKEILYKPVMAVLSVNSIQYDSWIFKRQEF